MRKEAYILAGALVILPMSFISNFIWIRLIKNRGLLFMLWVAIAISMLFESCHAINYTFYDPSDNNRHAVLFACLIMALESLGNWLMAQSSFTLHSAPKKDPVAYISTTNSLTSCARFLPLGVMTFLIDEVNFVVMICACVGLQIVVHAISYKHCVAVDKKSPTEIGTEVQAYLDK